MDRRARMVMVLLLLFAGAGLSYLYAVITLSGTTQSDGLSSSVNKSIVVVLIPKNSGVFGGANFTPSELTVEIGVNNTIKWINEDQLSAHSVTPLEVPAGFPKFNPIIIEPGQTATLKLSVPGTYVYYCLWHPGWLRGTITVRP